VRRVDIAAGHSVTEDFFEIFRLYFISNTGSLQTQVAYRMRQTKRFLIRAMQLFYMQLIAFEGRRTVVKRRTFAKMRCMIT
jgi:hypothetical protein